MSSLTTLIGQRGGAARLVSLALLLLVLGFEVGRYTSPKSGRDDHDKERASASSKQGTIWTCSMHPQIRQPEPGQCPICGMDLIPAAHSDEGELGPRMMSMSRDAMKLAEVETAPVERRFVDMEIPLVGKIEYDEPRVKTIAAWVPGRLDRLFVDYTGIRVKKGDHLVEIYSPDLYAAQEELLQAIEALKNLQNSASAIVTRSTQRTVDASREKLRLLGLNRQQVAAIEKRGTASATVQINAPTSGIVIHKNAEEGMYVKTGTPIYKVADLSKVWVMLDAYESDIAWIRYGQQVAIKTEAYGDRIFKGRVSFIDPVLNPKTRTVAVRVVVENGKGLLKPNMFARATIKARIGAGEQVLTQHLAGKWISPMHPEIIKDKPGVCDICGMPLVKAEDLGYVANVEAKPALVVPASAVLTTGERAVVYVRVPNRERPTFQGVEIRVGPRAGDSYIVDGGLAEGQLVVTHGNFKIDSALQLQAKPSMMNPEGGGPAPMGHAHHGASPSAATAVHPPAVADRPLAAPTAFVQQLTPIYGHYLAAQEALASDRETDARQALDALAVASDKGNMGLVSGKAHMRWMEIRQQLTKALEHRAHMQGIAGLRKLFIQVSQALVHLERTFGHSGKGPHRVAFCPMANDKKGAEWLQRGSEVRNPYYGSAMLRCGEIRETMPGKGTVEAAEEGGHHGSPE